jgi:transposase
MELAAGRSDTDGRVTAVLVGGLRCYCRLKDFRRIATRYDKLARNYFSALCLVAAVAFWL